MTHSEFVTLYIMAGVGAAAAFLERDKLSATPEGLYSALWLTLITIVFWPMVVTYYIVRAAP